MWIRLGFALVGIVGATIAVTAIVVALPQPAVGGTCGPGLASEAPITAFFDPGSIGAGAEPPAGSTAARVQWLAFVGECQAAADGRVLAGLGILVLSVLVALVGPALLLRNGRFGDGTGKTGSGGSPAGWSGDRASAWTNPSGTAPASWQSGAPPPWGAGERPSPPAAVSEPAVAIGDPPPPPFSGL
ncbi:MAG: hypothetical protein ACYCVN_08430 [Acidimicrobiales bacterium]